MAVLIRGYSFFILGLLYISSSLVGIKLLDEILLAVTFLALVQCLPVISGITRIVFIGLFGIGSLLLFSSNVGVVVWASAITKNVGIITLILFVPVLSVPFKFPRYQLSLQHMLHSVVQRGNNGIYIFAHGISHLIGVIANIACVTITYYMLKAGTGSEKLTMVAKAAARGYTSTVFWSPNSGAVGLVMAYWGGSVIEIIPFGIMLAGIALIVGWVENNYLRGLEARQENHRDIKVGGEKLGSFDNKSEKELKEIKKDFYCLSFAVSFLLSVVIFLDWLTTLGILVIVPILALVYPFIWSIFIKEQKLQWSQFNTFIRDKLPNMSNEVVIFLGAGFFAVAVGNSEIGKYLAYVFSSIAYSPTLLIAVIMVVFVVLSLIGFHPVLTATSIVSSLTPQMLGLPSTVLSVAVLAGWGLAITCSPFSACSLSLSNIIGENSITVGVKWQFVFTVLLFAATLIYFNLILILFGKL